MAVKVRYQPRTSLCIELDVESAREAIKQIAQFQEVFQESYCSACGSDNIQYVFHIAYGNEYYAMKCVHCGAKLNFIEREGGLLFAKREDENGKPIGHDGWHGWTK